MSTVCLMRSAFLLSPESGGAADPCRRVYSFPQWRLGSSRPSVRDDPGALPRHHISVSHIAMGSACVSPRSTSGLRDPDREHGGTAGTARRSSEPSVPSIPSQLVGVLGCEILGSDHTNHHTSCGLTKRPTRNLAYWTSWPS